LSRGGGEKKSNWCLIDQLKGRKKVFYPREAETEKGRRKVFHLKGKKREQKKNCQVMGGKLG